MFELIHERYDRLRRGFIGHHLHEHFIRVVALRRLLARIALGRTVMSDLAESLVRRDSHEQLEQVVFSGDIELIVLYACEKGAEYRLDDVFRIDAAVHALADAASGEHKQAGGVAIKNFARGLIVAAPQAADKIVVTGNGTGFVHR
jgi:hypothetical protein